MAKITSFNGPHRFLSNFAPAIVVLDQTEYPSVEHAYQAAKSDDLGYRGQFLKESAGVAKKLGRMAVLRPDWEAVKIGVMTDLVRQKFDPKLNPYLAYQLLSTGTADLIEGNYWGDQFWGECPVGIGQNHLGRILMKIRDELNAASLDKINGHT